MVGVRKRPEDSVATAKPMLTSYKSQELLLHWLHEGDDTPVVFICNYNQEGRLVVITPCDEMMPGKE
jgi:hypothetical protein